MKLDIPFITQRLSHRLADDSRQLSRHLRTGVLAGTSEKGKEFLRGLEMNLAECACLAADLERPVTPEQRASWWRRFVDSIRLEKEGM